MIIVYFINIAFLIIKLDLKELAHYHDSYNVFLKPFNLAVVDIFKVKVL